MQPRFFLPKACIDTKQNLAFIDDRQLIIQIRHVLRLKKGARIFLLDGEGTLYHGVVESASKQLVKAKLTGEEQAKGEPPVALVICLPLIKGERFDWALQKLTEIGVKTIVPLTSSRSIVKEKSTGKILRWQTIAREAAEQCERAMVPIVLEPLNLESFLEDRSAIWQKQGALALMCAERKECPYLQKVIGKLKDKTSSGKTAVVLIGPEGGFEQKEMDLAVSFGYELVSLGPRILRSETAAVYAASQIISFLESVT